jgi:hypothetical protein
MKKFFLASILFALMGLTLAAEPAVYAQGSTDISIKDPAEYNAYNNCITQTTPQAKAPACEAFLTQYPQSVVKKTVLDTLIDAYAATDAAKTIDASQRMLQLDPDNLKAMLYIVVLKKQLAVAAAQAKNDAQEASLLDDAAAMAKKGLAATKPAGMKDEDFAKQMAAAAPRFYSAISNDVLSSKKDLKGAVEAFRTELEYLAKNSPDATKVAPALNDTLLLGQTYTQLTPPDMVNGVWFLTRAENFAPADFKGVIDKQAKYWYKRFHGKEDGFADVLAKSATTIFPPPDFKIDPAPTARDIANKFVADNPDYASYALGDTEYVLANASKENAEKVWATTNKEQPTQIPGVVIAATATQIQLAVTDDAKADKKADFTINMKTPLADKDIPAVGSEVKNLAGIFDSYTQDPPQIIMKDGEIQAEKKTKPPVKKKPTAAHKASH